MGPCLATPCKLPALAPRVGNHFKHRAKHRRSHWTFTVGCLRPSGLTPRSARCCRFPSAHESSRLGLQRARMKHLFRRELARRQALALAVFEQLVYLGPGFIKTPEVNIRTGEGLFFLP